MSNGFCRYSIAATAALLLSAGICGCEDFLTKNVVFGGNVPTSSNSGSGGSSGGDSGGSDGASEPDDDVDGLSNSVELGFGLDTRTSDTDHDGFADGLEFVGRLGDPLNPRLSPTPFNRERILTGTQIVTNDIDGDGDGLGDRVEGVLGTDPDNPDSDEDGYDDGLEEIAGSDPLSSSSRPVRSSAPSTGGSTPSGVAPQDSDADGIADDLENLNGGVVNNADTDGDGYSDGIEFVMGSDAGDPASVPVFTADTASDVL